jgi:hypothetical protein
MRLRSEIMASDRVLGLLLTGGIGLLGASGAQTVEHAEAGTHVQPATAGVAPQEPRLEFMFESKVKLGEIKMSGTYNGFQRGTLQLLGGTFDGPTIHGSILPSSHDWPIYYGNGVRLTDVAYTYVTREGAQLFVKVDGYRYDHAAMKGQLLESERTTPAPNLLRTVIRVQAPDDSPYAWMNYNLFIGVAGTSSTSPGERVATLRVYRVL